MLDQLDKFTVIKDGGFIFKFSPESAAVLAPYVADAAPSVVAAVSAGDVNPVDLLLSLGLTPEEIVGAVEAAQAFLDGALAAAEGDEALVELDEFGGELLAGGGALEARLADGLLLGAGVLPPLPLESEDLTLAAGQPVGRLGADQAHQRPHDVVEHVPALVESRGQLIVAEATGGAGADRDA